jgi:outer membrane lipase/esterase
MRLHSNINYLPYMSPYRRNAMRPTKLISVTSLLFSTLLLTCASSAIADQANSPRNSSESGKHEQKGKIQFSTQISFGDSLSDVGTYAVGTIAAMGGGKFTINGAGSRNWTELMAAEFGLPAPCPAQTGLDGNPAYGLSVMPPLNHAGCNSYAQGGARVSSPIGIGNKLTGGANADLGFLTVPIVQQIQNYLDANGNHFDDEDIVFVMAGANDVFFQLGLLQAGATDPSTAITSVGQAAVELASAINSKIIGKGARYVVVLNIPDIAITPMAAHFDASTRGLVDIMVNTFNYQLNYGVGSNAKVLYVDAYTQSYSQYVNPGAYGLSNVTDTACDLSPDKNMFASSIICNAGNLAPGVNENNTYLFADLVHPTPYGYGLIADLVTNEMAHKGWRWKKHKAKD